VGEGSVGESSLPFPSDVYLDCCVSHGFELLARCMFMVVRAPFKISPFARTRPFPPYDVNLSHRPIEFRPFPMSPITHEAGAIVDRLSLLCPRCIRLAVTMQAQHHSYVCFSHKIFPLLTFYNDLKPQLSAAKFLVPSKTGAHIGNPCRDPVPCITTNWPAPSVVDNGRTSLKRLIDNL
jgi:hypothetical protein